MVDCQRIFIPGSPNERRNHKFPAFHRKNTTVFHRLPGGGTYGLLSWYPNAKPAKPSQGEIEEEESEAAAEEKSAAA